ncbi:MAG: Tex family protein [Dehalococcoidia bacterium]
MRETQEPTTTTLSPVHETIIAGELGLLAWQVQATALLFETGATVPFITRYRKEATGSLDEVAIAAIRDGLERLRGLDKRREAVLASLQERDLLSEELRAQLLAADTLTDLEDAYLPYRPKRRTRASIAREKGLMPLAQTLWAQEDSVGPLEVATYVNPDEGVEDESAALAGARDIMAEWVSEEGVARTAMRDLFMAQGMVRSKLVKGKEETGAKFRDYFEGEEKVADARSHRVLAMLRGEREGVLSLRISPPEEQALAVLLRRFVRGKGPASEQVWQAVEDGYKRLLAPSMETETWKLLKERADETAISVFAGNMRNLLLAPLLGQKAVLAIDPGFRTGCKVVCLDQQGKLLHSETIFLHLGAERTAREAQRITALTDQYDIEAIAIGNGTAGRETEAVVRGLDLGGQVPVVMVNESGASVYSVSTVAREEFPDQDVTVRGAVSIGRRLMDPLAELVKIEPKSIGVGQYQHDVDQTALVKRLNDVAESCVNAMGVEVNTASRQLLTYVSGLGPQLARAIVDYRDAVGPFRSRQELRKVPRLGPKAFEQAAGFLRVRESDNPLDATAVHPERYTVVEAMATSLGCTVAELMRDAGVSGKLNVERFVTDSVGLPTLRDIKAELASPGRDPRDLIEPFSFADGVNKVTDLEVGMRLPGVVTNVTAFGAFVDVGVHQDGLVHISQLSNRFVKDPHDVVKVSQQVSVTVLAVDLERNRISLSMRG